MQMNISVTESIRIAWSLADIAERTGLSENFLRYEVKRGILNVRKFGRRVLVTSAELQRYLNTGSEGGRGTSSIPSREK
jgi:hypothetical protein